MNTRKQIKAENDYVLRDAVKATAEEYPQLCQIFAEIKRRNPCGKRLALMVGKAHSGGLAIWHSKRSGTILLDRKELATMNEQEIQFLIGHELGHHLRWRDLDNKPKTSTTDNQNPHQPLMYLYWSIYDQIRADIVGVEQCRSAFIAGSHLSDGDSDMEAIFNDPWQPLTEKFYSCFELAIRIKALGLLNKSEYFYELIDSELLGFGRWQITSDEYFEKIEHLFDPYMNFTEDDGKALGVFLSAALFIAGCRVGDLQWRSELDLLAAFGEPQELLKFVSIDNAYERIVAVAASIYGMSHPLKSIVWNTVWDVTYRDWEDIDEALRFDDFLATCESGDVVMPADKPETCDEYIQCDGPYYADGFVYYDEIPAADTHVA